MGPGFTTIIVLMRIIYNFSECLSLSAQTLNQVESVVTSMTFIVDATGLPISSSST